VKNFTSANEADPVKGGSLYQLGSHSSIQPHWQTLPHFPRTQLTLDRFDSTAEAGGGRTRWLAGVGCSTTTTHNTSAAAAADSDNAPLLSAVCMPRCRNRGTTATKVISCPMVSNSAAAIEAAGSEAAARLVGATAAVDFGVAACT